MSISVLVAGLTMSAILLTLALADHSQLAAARDLAAVRAQSASVELVEECAVGGCQAADIPAGAQVCRTGRVLRVTSAVGWEPSLYRGLTPVTGVHLVDLAHLDPADFFKDLSLPSC